MKTMTEDRWCVSHEAWEVESIVDGPLDYCARAYLDSTDDCIFVDEGWEHE